ncbi:tyrosine-type recombinase/integrase, partial [Streptomyces sp. NPDC005989]|uniref:tyrosine-type recombinase/integrase n=1 Tax=Streptomyces sp. NPDC005989 TaxID=3156727 RepID=UPI0033D6691A
MNERHGEGRDLRSLDVPRVGLLLETGDVWEPYRLLDPKGTVVGSVAVYLKDLQGIGRPAKTQRSYGMDLLRWFRFLWAVGTPWDQATRDEARDFSRWIQISDKPNRAGAPAAAAVPNPVTGKASPGRKYAPATRGHSESVLRGFYDFHRDVGSGPMVNPFPLVRRGSRAHAHHNPMDLHRNERSGLYRPRPVQRVPRCIPDEKFNEVFAQLGSNRDRALVAFWVSTGARASELLGAHYGDADPGQQLITVIRKGTRAIQQLPASPDAFVWLRLYQAQMHGLVPTGLDDSLWWGLDPDTEQRLDLTLGEHRAFWSWAIVEVLRHTGIRIEELTELSHHSLVQYRLPGTGELIPLLHIAPSKTDAERLLVISPELADVLSTIISRIRDENGAVPLVVSYDGHERVWNPPMPLLFQRNVGVENRPIPPSGIRQLLNEALSRTRLTDTGGQPLAFSPHDFRRLFITDAIMNGMPPHIAQLVVGHRDINTTSGYKAVYPEEVINGHRAFIARRRATRPSEEYRTPTEVEWEEFLGHFERRRVALGDCGRAYGTSCMHEHSCLRCSLLRPDPDQ